MVAAYRQKGNWDEREKQIIANATSYMATLPRQGRGNKPLKFESASIEDVAMVARHWAEQSKRPVLIYAIWEGQQAYLDSAKPGG